MRAIVFHGNADRVILVRKFAYIGGDVVMNVLIEVVISDIGGAVIVRNVILVAFASVEIELCRIIAVGIDDCVLNAFVDDALHIAYSHAARRGIVSVLNRIEENHKPVEILVSVYL